MLDTNLYGPEEERILLLIDEHRLKEAIVQIQAMTSSTRNWKLRSEVEELQTSYNLMLDYARKGMKDPNFKEMYDKMIRKSYELTDWACIEKAAVAHPDRLYFRTKRHYEAQPSLSYGEIQLILESCAEEMAETPLRDTGDTKREKEIELIQQRHEDALSELFDKVWVSSPWNEETEASMYSMLRSTLIPVNDLCVLISAVTMAALKLFDIRKYMFLVKAYRHKDMMINQRALVGMGFISILYDWRITRYPQAKLALDELKDNGPFIQNLFTIQMQLLLTRETAKIDKKMKEDIIPGMMKNVGRSGHIGFEENDDDENFNPDWEKRMHESGLTDELRAMSELQLAGADVYMGSFAQFKHYPFFKKMSHWFYPFDRHYKELAPLTAMNENEEFSLINMLLGSDMFCNSDKYSFCFSLLTAPNAVRKMMIAQLRENAEALSEEEQAQLKTQLNVKLNAKQISRQYIHDLYRFFKLWERRSENIDIFQSGCQLWCANDLQNALRGTKEMKEIGDYLLQNEYIEEASEIFKFLADKEKNNSEYYQKIGYTQERQKQYASAIDWYKKSELLQSGDVWTLRHIARCLMKERRYHEAYEYYKQIETFKPDDLKLTMEVGRCLTMMQHYEEALTCFFKVEYLSQKSDEARRAIGWCSFVVGKYDQAQKYYEMLLSEPDPAMQDWINAGHVYQVQKQTEKAIACYKNAVNLCDNWEDFLTHYRDDRPYLRAQGLSAEKIDILPDELL